MPMAGKIEIFYKVADTEIKTNIQTNQNKTL